MGDWIDELLGFPGDIFGGLSDMFAAMGRLGEILSDPQTYVRIFMVVFGVLLIFGALRYA